VADTTRRKTFIVLTVLFGLGLGFGAFAFLALIGAWFGVGGREVHRVHDLAWGAHGGLLIALPLVLQGWRPEAKPAVMQGTTAAAVGLIAGYALGGEFVFLPIPAVVVGVLWWLHPARPELTRLGRRPQPVMLALAVLAAIPLVVYALGQAEIQRACVDGDQHCQEFHYAGMAALALAMPLAGAVASFRAPGWRVTALLVAAAAAVFGLSAILFPEGVSSVGTTWGAIALAGGVLFAAVSLAGPRSP
jgi:hypothetical protein